MSRYYLLKYVSLLLSFFQVWILFRQLLWLASSWVPWLTPPVSTSARLKAPLRRLAGALGHWASGPLRPPLL